jgi:SAM-dependent methyltransferase
VLCYLENPELAAAELARLLRPGGIGFISVEAWPGGLLSARDTSASEVTRVIESRTLHRPGDLFVRYFDRGALECLVTGAGLELVALRSHHHALEGPWSTVIADLDIGRATDEAEILRLEQALGADSEIGELGRGWLAIARKP